MSARRKMKNVVKECIKRILPIMAELLEDELEKKNANLDKKMDIAKR
jgi:hypothetical protein